MLPEASFCREADNFLQKLAQSLLGLVTFLLVGVFPKLIERVLERVWLTSPTQHTFKISLSGTGKYAPASSRSRLLVSTRYFLECHPMGLTSPRQLIFEISLIDTGEISPGQLTFEIPRAHTAFLIIVSCGAYKLSKPHPAHVQDFRDRHG